MRREMQRVMEALRSFRLTNYQHLGSLAWDRRIKIQIVIRIKTEIRIKIKITIRIKIKSQLSPVLRRKKASKKKWPGRLV